MDNRWNKIEQEQMNSKEEYLAISLTLYKEQCTTLPDTL